MSLRHKKRSSDKVSESHCRKILTNTARRLGLLKSGQCSADIPLDRLKSMVGGH